MLTEINFDGIIGPSHNYAGLSLGNIAATTNRGRASSPRAAALEQKIANMPSLSKTCRDMLDDIWRRTAHLATRLKQGLQSIPGATLYTPESPDGSAALVSFGLNGWKGEALCSILRERWNIIVKPLPHVREGLRISIAFFLLEEEIDRLLETVQRLAAERDETAGWQTSHRETP